MSQPATQRRPRIDGPVTKFLIRISEEHLDDIRAAAEREGLSVSEFIRTATRARVNEILPTTITSAAS
jgi:predicted HicB family RNase H-like nuclease